MDRSMPIAGECFAQRPDHRDAATHARLETDADPGARGGAKNLLAVAREQRLVRGNDVLAGAKRTQDQTARRLIAAEQLHYDIDVGALDERGSIARDEPRSDAEFAIRLEAAIGDADQVKRRPELLAQQLPISPQQLDHAAADGAASEQRYPHRLQSSAIGARRGGQETLAICVGAAPRR